MRKFVRSLVLAAFAVLSLTGCNSFRAVQEFSFYDDDGIVLQARYGALDKKYTYTLTSPINGATVEGSDNRLARIRLPEPNGSWIDCRICQNDFPIGTMYATKDGKWKYLTLGNRCRLYLQGPDKADYILVYEGRYLDSESVGK